MPGKIAGGGNGIIGAETATVMATQPDNIAQQQERGPHESRQRRGRRTEEPQLARQPHHHQRHGDKRTDWPAHLLQTRPDHRDQHRANDQQRQRQWPEEGERHLAGKIDGIEQMR